MENKSKQDFSKRRVHLENMNDEQLKTYFWELANKTIEPLIKLAKDYTSPSIERSILLRMGFSSLEANVLVKKVIDHDLISKGAGHIVYRLATIEKVDIRTAGLKLINDEGWNKVIDSFKESHND